MVFRFGLSGLAAFTVVGTAAGQRRYAWEGLETTFGVTSVATGSAEVQNLYGNCTMYDQAGDVLLNGDDCVLQFFTYMLDAAASAAEGWEAEYAGSGFGNVQESSVPQPPGRRSGGAAGEKRFTRSSSTSLSGPLSITRNASSNSLSVSVRTSGIGRRDYLPTNYDWFNYTGVDGLKLTVHNINGTASSYGDDLHAYAIDFASSGVFQMSDSWYYQICEKTTMTALFCGQITAEEYAATLNYENPSFAIPDCASDLQAARDRVSGNSSTSSTPADQTSVSIATASSVVATGVSTEVSTGISTGASSVASSGASTSSPS